MRCCPTVKTGAGEGDGWVREKQVILIAASETRVLVVQSNDEGVVKLRWRMGEPVGIRAITAELLRRRERVRFAKQDEAKRKDSDVLGLILKCRAMREKMRHCIMRRQN